MNGLETAAATGVSRSGTPGPANGLETGAATSASIPVNGFETAAATSVSRSGTLVNGLLLKRHRHLSQKNWIKDSMWPMAVGKKKTRKELIEDMFWARLGGFRG